MRVLAIEPYYGGSHRAFLDGWVERSRHDWTLLTLPAYKWKWRMRHSAVTLSRLASEMISQKKSEWDIVWCSDMLNLAEFLGLAPESVRRLPSIVYFHENQLTYPVIVENEHDYHFVFSNMSTALAARRVWFNSSFHMESFLNALKEFLRKMPDHQPLEAIQRIRAKSRVKQPSLNAFPARGARKDGPIRILWAARWEYDKGPEAFFQALELLDADGIEFHLNVVGGREGVNTPPVFEEARERFRERIVHWGYQDEYDDYVAVLSESDVVVSTSQHEFFGISVLEAVACGCYPLVPKRLAYPEILGNTDMPGKDSFFYDGNEKQLAGRMKQLAQRVSRGDLWQGLPERGLKAAQKYSWDRALVSWDNEIQNIVDLA
jgi:glycosyltransferase involved in cell wall biosynthesis